MIHYNLGLEDLKAEQARKRRRRRSHSRTPFIKGLTRPSVPPGAQSESLQDRLLLVLDDCPAAQKRAHVRTHNVGTRHQCRGTRQSCLRKCIGQVSRTGEPVWPSGKALGRLAEGPRFDTASALPSLQKGCGLWTLSCDFVHHFLLQH